ncbi:S8 family peptidase [Jiangella mangrovi]|uniref:Subtilisin family serine protease n=1 Tax=Jiangella mangrovi TaxID=1524084 RepID=A0A7W9GUU8_9ACTN|nr:S8 family serine peptidase [Jiangella mangrovi]MBB5790194.1 subtilisin family serine protease [Jiangella mangrovi]
MQGRDPTVAAVRLLVRPRGGDDRPARLRREVDRVLGAVDEHDRPWAVEPLFPGTPDPELRRYWVVSGAVQAGPAYDETRVAYDLAARLARELDADVEPDLPSSAFGAEPDHREDADDVDDAVGEESLGDTRGVHLAGSDDVHWVVDAVRAGAAWALLPHLGGSARGAGVLVGSVDTGYTDHPEVAGAWSFDLDYDVVDGDDDARDPLRRRWYMPLDSPGHGTHTASVIGCRGDGVLLGVAPRVTIVPIRTVKSVVQVLDGDVARAVHEAHRRGCKVITMSLGGRGFFGLRSAIRAAIDDGVIVMAAAGNKVGIVVAPASYPECIAVGATNADSEPWSGSSRGPAVDVSAPGESVWVASVDSRTNPPVFGERRHHGTSFAVATLAGVAALWIAHHGHDRIVAKVGRAHVHAAFLQLVRTHGHREPPGWTEHGWDELYGVGIVDAAALLAAPLPDAADLVLPEIPAAPEAADPVSRLSAVLSGLGRDEVRSRVGELLGTAPDAVDDLPPVTVSELVYRLGEDDALRAGLTTPIGDVELPARPGAEARRLLARTASRALRTSAGP